VLVSARWLDDGIIAHFELDCKHYFEWKYTDIYVCFVFGMAGFGCLFNGIDDGSYDMEQQYDGFAISLAVCSEMRYNGVVSTLLTLMKTRSNIRCAN
jgi:hypothetical protein